MTHFSTESKIAGEQTVDEERVSIEAHASSMGITDYCTAEAKSPAPAGLTAAGTVPGESQPCNAGKGQAQFLSAPESVQASRF